MSAAATAAFNYLSLFGTAGIRLDVFARKIKVVSGYCHMTKDGKHQYSHFKRRNDDQNTDHCRFVIMSKNQHRRVENIWKLKLIY